MIGGGLGPLGPLCLRHWFIVRMLFDYAKNFSLLLFDRAKKTEQKAIRQHDLFIAKILC